jgi:pyruvate/2-oxoglutarate dehydrogenase complex dihydrolipoamide acyltransferase (E2) component
MRPAARIDVKVPDIDDFKDVPVTEVLVNLGDTVTADEPLITLESDMATMDVPAHAVGKITQIVIKIGDKISMETILAKLAADRGSDSPDEADTKEEEHAAEAPMASLVAPRHLPPAPEGRSARQDNRLFLDGPAGVCYCFSELTEKRGRRFMRAGMALAIQAKRKRGQAIENKQLREMVHFAPPMNSRTYDQRRETARFPQRKESFASAGFSASSRPKTQGSEINGGFGARVADVARVSDSEMALQAVGIAKNGLGGGAAGCNRWARESISELRMNSSG